MTYFHVWPSSFDEPSSPNRPYGVMVRAIQVTSFGGPEVLEMQEVADPVPTDGDLLLTVEHAGVNYADTHQVENSYLSPTQLPFVPGSEVVGVDSAGRRWVGFTTSGGYAEKALVSKTAAVPMPEGVSNEAALACLVQGLTAWQLLRTSANLQAGESMLVHAAAGGVGTLLMQLGRHCEAGQIIGAVSSREKCLLLNSLGFSDVFICTPENLADEVKALTSGRGVDTCYEMVGGATGDESLKVLAPFGRLIIYGMAGRVPMRDVTPASLMHGSRSLVGFWLVDFVKHRPMELAASLIELLALVGQGVINPITVDSYPLAEAQQAHVDMRNRKTTGKVTLRVAG